jgi:hypothetical protein
MSMNERNDPSDPYPQHRHRRRPRHRGARPRGRPALVKKQQVIDLIDTCSFCEVEAGTRYQKVYFCVHHVLLFYLGLKYVSWID